jgi:hypothetical protein
MADQGGPRSSNVMGVGNLPRGQTYGTGVQQQRALQAVPLSPGPSRSPQPTSEVPAGLAPGQIPSLTEDTARPDEPISAGLPIGPGVDDGAVAMFPQAPPDIAVLRSLYRQTRNRDIRKLLEWAERQL